VSEFERASVLPRLFGCLEPIGVDVNVERTYSELNMIRGGRLAPCAYPSRHRRTCRAWRLSGDDRPRRPRLRGLTSDIAPPAHTLRKAAPLSTGVDGVERIGSHERRIHPSNRIRPGCNPSAFSSTGRASPGRSVIRIRRLIRPHCLLSRGAPLRAHWRQSRSHSRNSCWARSRDLRVKRLLGDTRGARSWRERAPGRLL
jgi:hypothetical protein